MIAVLVICLVLFSGGKKGGVFGTDCDRMAAKQVLSYDVFYPESFEEAYDDGGVYLKYGSVENGDFFLCLCVRKYTGRYELHDRKHRSY